MIEWIKRWTAGWSIKRKNNEIWAADISDGLTLARDFLRRFRRSHLDPEILFIVVRVMECINQEIAAENLDPDRVKALERIVQAVQKDDDLAAIIRSWEGF